MSLKLGLSKKKTRSQTTSNAASTKTPTVPDWATGLVRSVASRVAETAAIPAQVAGPDALQLRAAEAAGSLGGAAGADTSGWAQNLTRQAADTSWLDALGGAPTASDGMSRYVNPYLRQVVDTTGADLDADASRVRAQQSLDLARSGAFGGSGAALTQSQTEGELARARASALGTLRSQAWTSALGASTADADRAAQAQAQAVTARLQAQQQQLAAANQAMSLQAAADAQRRDNIATQAAVGGTLRDIAQQQAQAPLTSTAQIVALLSGLPLDLFRGEQTTSTSDETSRGRESGISADLEYTRSK